MNRTFIFEEKNGIFQTAIEEKKVADAKIQELQRQIYRMIADKKIVDDALQEANVKIQNLDASLEVANTTTSF